MASRPPLGIALMDTAGAPQPKKMSKGQIIAGIIGDALAGAAGRGPAFGQMLAQQRQYENEQAQQQAQWGLQRRARLEDWQAQQDYERAHPAPTAPHYFETNNGSVGMIGPDGKPQIVYNDPTPKMNFIPDGLGGGQWVSVPNQAPSMPVAPAKPVGTLIPIQGGPTPPASGGFRRFP
jgi:hypothetical protein